MFAQGNAFNSKNVEKINAQITKHILKEAQQGKMRTSNMFVVTENGKIEYVAATPEKVKFEMEKLY